MPDDAALPTVGMPAQVPADLGLPSSMSYIFDVQKYEAMKQISGVFSKGGDIIPKAYQNNPHACFMALHMAMQLREDPIWVMNAISNIQGRPAWKAEYAIARANKSGIFNGNIGFRVSGSGDNLAVTAHATLKQTGEVVEKTVDMKMAKADGWTKNPKYQSIPEQMLSYRSAMFLIRLHCPEVLQAMTSTDEIEDVAAHRGPDHAKNITPTEPAEEPLKRRGRPKKKPEPEAEAELPPADDAPDLTAFDDPPPAATDTAGDDDDDMGI